MTQESLFEDYNKKQSKRKKLERKALKFLYGEKAAEHYLLDLDLRFKQNPNYEEHLKLFKKLFQSGNEDLRTAAWNCIIFSPDGSALRKEDFTEEEWEFLCQLIDAMENRPNLALNPNPDIPTDRLILSAAGQGEQKLYTKHLEKDGDFKMYTSRKPTRKNIADYWVLQPFCYAVFERESGRMVGAVDLHRCDEKRRLAEAAWYIFKPYRGRGYAKEAVTALAREAFAGRLTRLAEQARKCTYKKCPVKIELIRAETRHANLPSQALARSCGFVHRYTDHRFFVVEGEGPEDAEVFELTPADLAAGGNLGKRIKSRFG